jgi:hypothetical protein
MSTSPLKKNEFIDLVSNAFLNAHPRWVCASQKRREYLTTVGRTIEKACFIWISFSCRPDRYKFGHSVGWSPSREAHLHRLELKENPPIWPNDGSLRRIRTLEKVRQFELPEMSRSISGLYLPYQDYNLETTSAENLKHLMLNEIEEYALPFLCLMLRSRHALEVTPEQLGTSDVL